MPIPALVNGCMLKCSFGAVCPIVVPPLPGKPMINGMPMASIADIAPVLNIATFGMCIAPTNPAFISATAAALGVPTPVPCTPIIVTPTWLPPSPNVMIAGVPAATTACVAGCAYLGVINVVAPLQVNVNV